MVKQEYHGVQDIFGYKIIDSFRKLHPQISVKDMLEMSSEEIFAMSNYHEIHGFN